MNVRRREALGRNRRGPATTGTMGTMLALCVAVLVLAAFAYKYVTQPERVYGHKALDCAIHEITWTTGSRSTVISGCGRKAEAVCASQCFDVDSPEARTQGGVVLEHLH